MQLENRISKLEEWLCPAPCCAGACYDYHTSSLSDFEYGSGLIAE